MPSGAVLGDNTYSKHKAGNNKADTKKVRSFSEMENAIGLTQRQTSLKVAEKPVAQAESKSLPPKGRHKLRASPPSRHLRSSRSRSVSPSGGFGSLSAAPAPLNPAARLLAPPSSTAFEAASTGLSAHPTQSANTPLTTKQTIKRKVETQPEDPDCQPVRKHPRRAAKTPLSKEIISDSDASNITVIQDTEDTMRTKKQKSAVTNTRDSSGPKSQTPDTPDYIDLSEGLSGFEYFDENGAPAKRPHGRLALVNGEVKDALTVKLKLPPQKMQDKLQELQSPKRHPMSNLPLTSKNTTSNVTSTPLLKTIRPSTRSHPSPSMPPLPHFPPFPPLTATQLPHFTNGLTIAIENIISDHAASPTLSVLDIISDLEDDAPTLPHDDWRQVVMRGNQYVYDAVRMVVGEREEALVDGGAGVGAEAEEEGKKSYKEKGRASKKTAKDENLGCASDEEKGRPRKGRKGGDTWAGTEDMFAGFCAHVRGEYENKVEALGVEVDEELPDWLVD